MYYKANDNSVHCIDPAFEHLLPAGCVSITEQEAQALRLQYDQAPAPELTLDQIKDQARATVRAARKPVFYTLAGMQSEALATGDTATATAIVGIQQALKALPETDLSACLSAAEVDAAFVAAWLAIAYSAPANVVSAFNEVLA